MIGAVVRLNGNLWPKTGKENGRITQMMDKMNTTKVPMAEPDTMALGVKPRI